MISVASKAVGKAKKVLFEDISECLNKFYISYLDRASQVLRAKLRNLYDGFEEVVGALSE